MSIQAMAWAFKQDVSPASAKLLLLAIANYANSHMQCWPSKARLSKDTNLSPKTVYKALNILIELGLITSQERYHEGAQLTSLITIRAGGDVDSDGDPLPPEGDRGVSPFGDTPPVHGVRQNHHLTIKESSSTRAHANEPPASDPDTIRGDGWAVDLRAVDMEATLQGIPIERARSVAQQCAMDWTANQKRPPAPMATIRRALREERTSADIHQLRVTRLGGDDPARRAARERVQEQIREIERKRGLI